MKIEVDLQRKKDTATEYTATKGFYFKPSLDKKSGKLKNESELTNNQKIEREGYFLLPKLIDIMGRENFLKAELAFLKGLESTIEKQTGKTLDGEDLPQKEENAKKTQKEKVEN